MKRLILGLGILVLGCKTSRPLNDSSTVQNVPRAEKPVNGVLMQYFHWYLTKDDELWKKMAKEAPSLSEAGITALWLPPAYKGTGGENDVGYGVYDLYDLGEFNQHGSVRTKYGTKADYLAGIKKLRENGISSYADIVLNHRFGAEGKETVKAVRVRKDSRMQSEYGTDVRELAHRANNNLPNKELVEIEAWTRLDFPGRKGKYSDFKYNWTHFKGTDWDAKSNSGGLFLFEGKTWNANVDSENGNYDYLMASDIDFDNSYVVDELTRWGKWYVETTGVDGFRIDAVKHIDTNFWKGWLREVRKDSGKDLFAVGEYLNLSDVDKLTGFVRDSGEESKMHVFDFPLHTKFYQASSGHGNFDMATLFEGTVLAARADRAVTFVDNHDTQPCQAFGYSAVKDWFKPLGYAFILLNKEGYPNIFYPDYYGMKYKDGDCETASIGHRKALDILLSIRKDHAFGGQRNYARGDYGNSGNVVGFTRDGGDYSRGLALLINDSDASSRWMQLSPKYAKQSYCDIYSKHCVTLNADGAAEFHVPGGGMSVYLAEDEAAQVRRDHSIKAR